MNHHTSIIYYTDNFLSEPFFSLCQRKLLEAADGKPIVSVSQKPMNFASNICVGDIGRSHLSLYRQMLVGGEHVRTKYIALAEHDCLYTPEHFNWIPPRSDIFYYNVNHYFVQGSGRRFGEYSYARRRPLSMLISGRDVFLKAITEKLWMLEHGWMIKKGQGGACEPGVIPSEDAMLKTSEQILQSLVVEPGVLDHRKLYLEALREFKDLGKEVDRWKAKAFRTVLPNLDIRTGENFSGGRRAKDGRTYELPYWGRFEGVMNG